MNNCLSVSVWTEELRGRKRRICLSVSVWTEELRGRKRRICLSVSVWTEELRGRKRRICLSVIKDLRKMDSYEGSPLSWSETSINIKLWREDYLDAARSIFTGM